MQGINVHGVTFRTPFFGPEKAIQAAKRLQLSLTVLDITEDHLIMLKAPRYGYGRNMNPCIDCHTLMLHHAGKLMESIGADFIITGEVAGQRPMSQGKQTLVLVARNSGYGDYILRPLSAQLLPETKPEREGLVDRNKLLGIQGRGRKEQLKLAAQYGITEYSTPAGGCLLTDPSFSRRLKDLLSHNPEPQLREIELLKYGRHFRISPEKKIIVGRNSQDNKGILSFAAPEDEIVTLLNHPGPTVLIIGGGDEEIRKMAVRLCLLYGGLREGDVCISSSTGERVVEAEAMGKEEAKQLIIT